MRLLALLAVIALVSVIGLPQLAQASFTILLTSFDPFGGSSANNTQAIVADLSQMASSLGTDVVVKTCNLPVVYDRAADAAMECVAKVKPDAVVSFGEAACSLRIETAATNLDDTPGFPDNAGQIRAQSGIVPGGVQRAAFDFPILPMYCALGGQSSSVDVSSSPGAFVCNNTAYHLSQNLEAEKVPFTFIHVPNTRCTPEQVNPSANATTIAQMLHAAIAELRLGASGSRGFMPSTQSQAQSLLQSLQSKSAPACEQQFVQRLISAYQNPQ